MENPYLDSLAAVRTLREALDRLCAARKTGMFVPPDCIEALADAIIDCDTHEALASVRETF